MIYPHSFFVATKVKKIAHNTASIKNNFFHICKAREIFPSLWLIEYILMIDV